jgi:hypothetical protein
MSFSQGSGFESRTWLHSKLGTGVGAELISTTTVALFMRRGRAGPHGQIFRHEIDKHGGEDQDQSEPETPIAMGEFPIGAMGRRAILPTSLILVQTVLILMHGLFRLYLPEHPNQWGEDPMAQLGRYR